MTFDKYIEQYGETIHIWGATEDTDDLGNPISVWNADKDTFIGVLMRPTANAALFDAGRVANADKKLLAPSDADIISGDRLEIDDVMYDLIGVPADWQMKIAGTVQHLQIFLRRVL